MWRGPAVPQSAWFLSVWMPDRVSVWFIQENVCRCVHRTSEIWYILRENFNRKRTFCVLSLHSFLFILFSPSLPFTLHYFFTPPVQLALFFVLLFCCCCLLFCGRRAAAVFQPLLPAPTVATGLLITSPAAEDSLLPLLLLLSLFVIHCVVTLMIMDSAQVFRLSAGSWSLDITLALTCTQTCTGMHTYRVGQCNKFVHAWLHMCTRAHGWKHTNAIHSYLQVWWHCFFLSDVNECWRYPGRLCAQTCENTPGSYKCSCTSGFRLSDNGKNCEGVFVNVCLHGYVYTSMWVCWCMLFYVFVNFADDSMVLFMCLLSCVCKTS